MCKSKLGFESHFLLSSRMVNISGKYISYQGTVQFDMLEALQNKT